MFGPTLDRFEVEGFNVKKIQLQAQGTEILVHGLDKFPRMTDYVIPTGVRIADANRVRLEHTFQMELLSCMKVSAISMQGL